MGDTISVSDLIVPAGVTVLTDPEHGIATVEMPKDQIAAADESAASLAEDADKPVAEEVVADAEVEAKEAEPEA